MQQIANLSNDGHRSKLVFEFVRAMFNGRCGAAALRGPGAALPSQWLDRLGGNGDARRAHG